MVRKTKVVIFGTGKGALGTVERLDLSKVEITCFLDSNPSRQGCAFFGAKVISPEAIAQV